MQIPRTYQNPAGVASMVSRLQAGLPMKMTDWWYDVSEALGKTVRLLYVRTSLPCPTRVEDRILDAP